MPAARWRMRTYPHTMLRLYNRLPQRFKCQIAIKPAIAVAFGRGHFLIPMGSGAIKTRFQRPVRLLNDLLGRKRQLSEPKLPLLRRAGEDDIGESLDFLPCCRI